MDIIRIEGQRLPTPDSFGLTPSSLLCCGSDGQPAALQRPRRGLPLPGVLWRGDHHAVLPHQHALLPRQPGGRLRGHHLLHALPALRAVRGLAGLRGLRSQSGGGE